MREEESRGLSVAYTFCLWEGLLEEAEAIAARISDVELTESAISEESVREYCSMKYRAAVALSIGLASLECFINEYLRQRKMGRKVRTHAKRQRLHQPSLESNVRAVLGSTVRDRTEKEFLRTIVDETLPMRDFLLELKALPYNFDLGELTGRRAKPRDRQVRAFSNLNRTFVLDSLHAIRSLADILSSTRVGMPKPMIFFRFGMRPVT